MGTSTIQNIKMQVKNEAKGGVILFFTLIKLKTGLKMPVITEARIIIDINGHISHASIAIERIKRDRKNQKMIFRELLSRIAPPRTKSTSSAHGFDLTNRLTDNLPLGIKFRSGNNPFGPVWWKIARRQMQRAGRPVCVQARTGRRRQATGKTSELNFCALRSLFLTPGLKIRDFLNDPLYLLIMPKATNKRRISNMKTEG